MALAIPPDEAADLATLPEIFANATLPEEPLRGPFGVCYVAFAGTHDRRYRGEKLLEAAATQLRAASAARGATIQQCVFTDQPERPRPYVDLLVPLRTPLDATPFVAGCGEYTRRFKRPCKLLFGYMAKPIAVARSPYTTTLFVDTDTFVCDAAPLVALGQRLLSQYDLLLHMPRTTQGWVNSGVLGVRRQSASGWATAWQQEFTSLDDFGDQLHLMKVLPQRGTQPWTPAVAPAGGGKGGGKGGGGRGKGAGGRGKGGGRGGGEGAARRTHALTDDSGRRLAGGDSRSISIGELPPELHLRVGSVADGAMLKFPALRGPSMLLHSKGLAALGSFTPYLGEAARQQRSPSPAQRQLLGVLGDGTPEAKKKGEHALYSPRVLAGFCLLLNDGWTADSRVASRQLVLNANGTCTGCARLPRLPGAIGVIEDAPESGGAAAASGRYECTETSGACGVVPATWPVGTERGLPEWYVAHTRKLAMAARATRAEL